jgi:hypothetical protein
LYSRTKYAKYVTIGSINSAFYQRRYHMRLSAPKKATWWIAVIVGVVGILANFVTIPVLSGFAFWLVVIGFVLLALGTYLKGF